LPPPLNYCPSHTYVLGGFIFCHRGRRIRGFAIPVRESDGKSNAESQTNSARQNVSFVYVMAVVTRKKQSRALVGNLFQLKLNKSFQPSKEQKFYNDFESIG